MKVPIRVYNYVAGAPLNFLLLRLMTPYSWKGTESIRSDVACEKAHG